VHPWKAVGQLGGRASLLRTVGLPGRGRHRRWPVITHLECQSPIRGPQLNPKRCKRSTQMRRAHCRHHSPCHPSPPGFSPALRHQTSAAHRASAGDAKTRLRGAAHLFSAFPCWFALRLSVNFLNRHFKGTRQRGGRSGRAWRMAALVVDRHVRPIGHGALDVVRGDVIANTARVLASVCSSARACEADKGGVGRASPVAWRSRRSSRRSSHSPCPPKPLFNWPAGCLSSAITHGCLRRALELGHRRTLFGHELLDLVVKKKHHAGHWRGEQLAQTLLTDGGPGSGVLPGGCRPQALELPKS